MTLNHSTYMPCHLHSLSLSNVVHTNTLGVGTSGLGDNNSNQRSISQENGLGSEVACVEDGLGSARGEERK